jgi:hypothetical protein
MEGHAFAEYPKGRTVSCRFDWVFEVAEARRTAELVEYTGAFGGDIQRTVLESDGSGLSLWADVYWPETLVRLLYPDSLELVLADTTQAEGRFWREIGFLGGHLIGNGEAEGEWTCAPFDIYQGGYVDTSLVAVGSWRLEPVAAP